MSSLQAALILSDPDKPVTHTLFPVIPGQYVPAQEFCSLTRLHDGNSIVQRGTLFEDEETFFPTVCKFAYGSKNMARLKHEAELYENPHHLQSLQGRYVPRFYGYYEGPSAAQDDEDTLGCLFLEDCGRRVAVNEWTVYETKCKIVAALLRLHHTGHLMHGDLHWDLRHILINKADESVRIIDFDHSFEHQCKHTMSVDVYAYQPERRDFNCKELYEFFTRLGVWTPIDIRFVGRPIHIFRAPTVRRLMKFADYYHPNEDNSYLIPKAKEVLDDYYRTYSNRFPVIGLPLHHKLPLNLPGVTDEEPEDEKLPPFEPPSGWQVVHL